jgi:prepilin-type N-terminal cleavage/methylation domain-containing protein
MAKRRILSRLVAAELAPTRVAGTDMVRPVRAGMTLIECMVALVILSGSLLALGNFMGKYAHTTTMAAASGTALDLATDRIDAVRHAQVYATIPSLYAAVETIPEATGVNFTRTTTIKHIGGGPTDTLDVMVVTVKVAPADSSGATISKTLVIGNF